MPEADDIELLAQFARDDSETAFAALARRHVNLVYSVALRRVGNPHAAEEITQAVFIILARKAKSLSAKTILSGWLHQTARLTAANYLRAEIRRRRHEQEACMQTILTESASDETWRQLAPLLDEAIARLRVKDRDALILRYFENKSLREVGVALDLEERAAQKRVDRAVEKLRHYFSKRGIALTTAIIAGVISANSVQAAPAGLVVTVTAAAAKGAAVGSSILVLVKGTLKIMAWAKAKMAIVIVTGVLLAAGVTTLTTKEISTPIFGNSAGIFYGTVHYRVMSSYINFDRLYNFAFQVEGRKWAVKIEPIYCRTDQTNDLIVPDYEFGSYDGKTAYDVISFATYTYNHFASFTNDRISAAQVTVAQASRYSHDAVCSNGSRANDYQRLSL